MKMKMILGFLAALALCAGGAQAQQYTATTLDTGTNVIGTNATLSPASATVTATKNGNVAWTVSFSLTGAGTANVVTSWAKGVDGTNYESTPSVLMTNAANGTNTVVGFGNTAMGAGGYLKLVSINNANTTNTVTNLVVKTALKPAN